MALAFALKGGRESFAFAATFLVLAATPFVSKSRDSFWRGVRPALPFAALLAWCALCLVASPPMARHLYRLAQLTAYLIVLIAASTWSRDERRRFMAGVISLAAIDALVFLTRRLGDDQATGYLVGNPSYTGLLCGAAFLGALALARDGQARHRLFGALCGIIFLATLVLLRSRSALVGVVFGLAFLLPARRFGGLLAVLAAGTAVAWFVDPDRLLAYVKIDPTRPHEWLGRLQIWRTALSSIPAHPVFGWGLGNFEAAYLKHQLPVADILRFDRSSPFAHNDFLQIAVEAGVPALVLFGWGLARYVRSSAGKPDATMAWSRAVVALFAASALFNFTILLPLCGMIGAAALGFGFSGEKKAAPHRLMVPAAALFAALLAAFVILSAIADRLVKAGRADAATRVMPLRADLWYAAAMIRIQRQDWIGRPDGEAEVFARLDRAAAADPGDAFIWNRLGVVSMSVLDAPMDPRDAFDRAVTLAPGHAPFWIDSGFERLEAGDLAGARQRFEKAASLEPNAPIPPFSLALTAAKAGDAAEAKRLVERAAGLHRAYAGRVPPSGYSSYLFGLDESQMRQRVSRMIERAH